MPLAPLTHHDILGLAEPFSRCGRQLELAASDWGKRHLAFKPVAHAGADTQAAALTETLLLEALDQADRLLLQAARRLPLVRRHRRQRVRQQAERQKNNLNLQFTAAVPKPGTWVLMLAGCARLAEVRRYRQGSRAGQYPSVKLPLRGTRFWPVCDRDGLFCSERRDG